MTYDFDYFSGADLYYPNKPTKPRFGNSPTAAEARDYADDIEYYEKAMKEYKFDCDRRTRQINTRIFELKTRLRDEYDITEDQMHLIWGKAYEDGHSEGLCRVVGVFKELYEIASQFAALEK